MESFRKIGIRTKMEIKERRLNVREPENSSYGKRLLEKEIKIQALWQFILLRGLLQLDASAGNRAN